MVSTAVVVITAIVVILIIVGIVLLIINISGDDNGIGNSCNNSGDCKNGLVCDSQTATCRVAVGDTCNTTSDCISGACCINSTCVFDGASIAV